MRVRTLGVIASLSGLLVGLGGYAANTAQAEAGESGASAQAATTDTAAPAYVFDRATPIPATDIAERARAEGVSLAEAERRFRVELAAGDLQVKAQSRWPDTFAGLWIDQAQYGVVLAFTSQALTNVVQLASSFAYPSDLRAVPASTSLNSLLRIQEEMIVDRDLVVAGTRPTRVPSALAAAGPYDLDIDLPAGELVVRTASTEPTLAAALTSAYKATTRVEGGVAVPTACGQFDCRYAMLGGIELATSTGYVCSSAFATFAGSVRSVMSAGHCYTDTGPNGVRRNAAALYGNTNLYQKSGKVDAERIPRNTSTPWRESSKFYVHGENPRPVTSFTTYANLVLNAYIGKTGRTTGTTRGYIKSKTVAPSYVPSSSSFIHADFCVDGGDSGGAVWSSNSALGIISGRFTSAALSAPNCRGASFGGQGIFGSIEYAKAAMGVSILTGVNLAPRATFTQTCNLLLACSYDGTGSNDEDGSITSYTWNFGDGSTGSGATTSHTYALPGSYTTTLTVKDNSGATHTFSGQAVFVATS